MASEESVDIFGSEILTMGEDSSVDNSNSDYSDIEKKFVEDDEEGIDYTPDISDESDENQVIDPIIDSETQKTSEMPLESSESQEEGLDTENIEEAPVSHSDEVILKYKTLMC
jgi:hypothetical protein